MISDVQTYPVLHRRSEYVTPSEAKAEYVIFDDTYMHIHLRDKRIVSVPLSWVPSLAVADQDALQRYQIGWDGALIYWDPEDGPINEDLMVAAYLRGGVEDA